MDAVNWLMPNLTQSELFQHGFIFILNIVLFIFAKPILKLVAPNQDNKAKVNIFRALNVFVLLLHVLDLILRKTGGESYESYFIDLGLSLMVIYAGVFIYSFLGALSKKRFGRSRAVDGVDIYVETYNSRLVSIVLLAIVTITTIYALIKVWGADGLLETTGIFGIFIAFLAFTSSIWAPDIISGLIILNSDILEDGDVVTVSDSPNEYIIARVTLIYVVLYDVRNNHRTLIRNSQFLQNRIDNISRIASSDGVRQALTYKIGYPKFSEDIKLREAELTEFKSQIDGLFLRSFNACKDDEHNKINENKPFEWALTNAGDYALEYTLWIYLQRIPNTKVTSRIRRHLMGTIYKVNDAVYTASILSGIDLSTPDLVQARISQSE
ncbi:MAG: hypothetical protein ABJG88_08225 [Litorimonas sp.]